MIVLLGFLVVAVAVALLYNKIYLISLRRFHASVFFFNFPQHFERDCCFCCCCCSCCRKMQGKASRDDDDANFGLVAVASFYKNKLFADVMMRKQLRILYMQLSVSVSESVFVSVSEPLSVYPWVFLAASVAERLHLFVVCWNA